jgi:NADPH-dependent curcumin reductase CurA
LIKHYGDDAPVRLANFPRLFLKTISIKPFNIGHHEAEYPAALAELENMVMAGRPYVPERVHEGFGSIPNALLAMWTGDGVGTHVVLVNE